MIFKFKPSDFKDIVLLDDMARHANELLAAHVRKLPKLYGCYDEGFWAYGEDRNDKDTSLAIIWSIEPIKQECEEHEPNIGGPNPRCIHCAAPLRAKWEVVE